MLGIRLPLLAVRHVDGPVEEGVVELAQVGDFHRPIVHLHVDVGMDVGVPSRRAAVVPDSLQVAWQGHSARRGNGKVTAIGKIELLEQQFVRFRAVVFDESIGRLALRSGIGKVQTHAVEESLIVCHMLAVDRCPPFLGGLVQTAAYGVCQVFGCGTTDVGRLRVVEIGDTCQIDDHLVGTADGDAARIGGEATAGVHHLEAGVVAHHIELAAEVSFAVAVFHRPTHSGCEADGEVEFATLRCGITHGYHLCRIRSNVLTGVFHTVGGIAHRSGGGGEVEGADIVVCAVAGRHLQRTEVLVRTIFVGT